MERDETPGRFGREAVWVLAMTLLGAGLRLKGLATLGLDHFDEGIYAQAATWIFADGGLRSIDPGLVPYAPPGYPILVGLAYAAIGPSGTASILVSILAGVLTIPVLSWFARRSFGRGAGAATAALVALAGPHVVLSRTGLTDATFLLAWSLAMLAGAQFLDRPGAWRAARLGLLVGLTQLVKYNGWMVGAIVAITVLLGAIRPGEDRRSAPRTILLGLLAAAISAVVYLPWFVFVERTTGYAGLLAHHRSYIDGLPGWWPNWRQQMAQAQATVGMLRGGISWLAISVGLAWVGSAIGQGTSPRAWGRFRHLGPILALILAAISIALAPPNLTWWAALAWSPVLIVGRHRPSTRLAAAWFLVMAASTPLYHPYARLWMPTLAATWILGGGLIAVILTTLRGVAPESETEGPSGGWRWNPTVIAAILGVVLAAIGPRLLPDTVRWFPDPLARSDGIRRATDAFRPGQKFSGPGVSRIHLYARPPLRYSLLQVGTAPIAVHGDLESIRSLPRGAGEVAVIDAGMGVNQPDAVIPGEGWQFATVLDVPASISSVLDTRPESVYRPSARVLGAAPSGLDGGDPIGSSVAGSALFWIFESP